MPVFNIRRSVFETNSSSSHALSVFKKDKSELKNVPEVVDIVLSEFQFGWESRDYCSFEDKLAYIWLCAGDARDVNERESLYNRIKAYLYDAGVKEVNIIEHGEDDGEWDYGYIDHGDMALDFVHHLLKYPSLFYGWLFNRESTISCGNDNDDNPGTEVPGADYVYIKGN